MPNLVVYHIKIININKHDLYIPKIYLKMLPLRCTKKKKSNLCIGFSTKQDHMSTVGAGQSWVSNIKVMQMH